MLKAIIFDFDGVIVETSDIKTTAFARLFAAEEAALVGKIVAFSEANGGMSRFDKFRHFYSEFLHRELSAADFQRLCREFSELVMDQVIAAPFVPGTVPFLEMHHAHIPCYIASATPQDELQAIVDRRELARFFSGVYGSPRKKCEIIAHILAEQAIDPDQALFVGDALNDHRAAAACRVPFVGREIEGGKVFEGIGCPTIKDLWSLSELPGLGGFAFAEGEVPIAT